jgi:hypothetical protein
MKRAWIAGTLAGLLAASATAGGLPPDEAPPAREPVGASAATGAPVESATGAPVESAMWSDPRSPEPIPLGARLPEGGDASEHWDLAAHFHSGHRLYARVLITSAGPGDRAALAFGHLLRPDGPPIEFRNGKRAGSWRLSADRRRIEIGSSVLALGETDHHFEVDNDKRDIEIALDFRAEAGHTAPAGPGGYRMALLNLATPARARIRVAGMDAPRHIAGNAVLTHSWVERDEAELLLQRSDVAGLAPYARFFLSELRTRDGARWRWLVTDDESLVDADDDLVFETTEPPDSPYPIPTALDMRGKGLGGRISFGRTLLEVDPLAALPALLRIVYPLAGKPRHVWVEASAEVALKSPSRDAALRLRGEGIATLVFLDARPPELR